MITFQDLSIKAKVMTVIMLTTVTALLLTTVAFVVYDLVSYRQAIIRNLVTTSAITAENSTAVLTFVDEENAQKTLDALKADRHIVLAALYDVHGQIFVRYPATTPLTTFPTKPGKAGHRIENGFLTMFQPVVENGRRAGTLYIKSDLAALYQRLRLYVGIAFFVLLGSVIAAFALSSSLQRRITNPILSLADVAKVISERRDYSIRAQKHSDDELGLFTDAFNLMLARIQEQTVALRDSEEQRRLSLEASRTGAWDWEIDSNRIIWDGFLHSLFGIPPGAFTGTYEHFLKLIHSDDRQVVTDAVADALAKRTELAVEFRVLWPDGSLHYIASRGKGFYSEDGKPLRLIGLCFEITERRKAEEVRSFLAAIVDSSDDAVVGKDLQSRVVSWNAGAERMFGYSKADMLGQPITRLLAPDRPDEETRIMGEVERGEIRHFETIRIRKDGSAIEVSLTVSPIKDASGKIIGISSIARDITDRRRAQQALERHATILREQAQMLDLANILARDLDDHIILWNTGMENMYGWSKSEALGRSSHELFRTQFSEPLESIRAALLSSGHWEGELIHTRKDGQAVYVFTQWILHRDPSGRPIAIIEVNNDITGRKQAEEEVRRMNLELEQRVTARTAELTAANQEMEAFTYSVAHDLRAPLRHIDAFSRILHEDFADSLPPEAQRYLQSIRTGSRNMSRLVDDLLNLARVGRQELKRQPIALDNLVTDVITDLKSDTRDRAIEWRVQHLPVVKCDSGLMKQVFTNLLSNAVKYTRPRDTAVIEIGASPKNGETAVFVRDNGVGFNMKYADKLFGVFQRLHRAEEFEGTGVGLATVERIVRKHGGSVWAEAELDKGATFYFSLPSNDLDSASLS